jgi:hypothetical protein
MANLNENDTLKIWNSATIVPEDKENGKTWRKDYCGAWIRFDQHGKEFEYGWEVDHMLPEAKGGTLHFDNLAALHWRNNRSKADNFPEFKRALTSENDKNIEKDDSRCFTKETIKRLKEIYPNNQYLKI